MSKEKDLLKKILATGWLNNTISCEVEELLAQPEQNNTQYLLDQVARLTAENAMLKEKWLAQPEQEPVVWQVIGIAGFMYVYNKPIDQVYEHHTVNALYLAPPKREPLSGDKRQRISKAYSTRAFEEGIIFAKILYGIGGEPLSNEQKRLGAIAIKQREAHGFGGGE